MHPTNKGRRRQAAARNAAAESSDPEYDLQRFLAPDSSAPFSAQHTTRRSAAAASAAFRRVLLERVLTVMTLCPLLLMLFQHKIMPSDGGMTLLATAVILLARTAPVVRTRERSLTFAAPVAFAFLLWTGAFAGAMGALLAGFLHSRFPARNLRGLRRQARMQGVHIALGLLLAEQARIILSKYLPVAAIAHAPALLFSAAASAVTFALVLLMLTWSAEPKESRTRARLTELRAYLSPFALTLAFGLLPVVLLTPLAAALGPAVALPAGLLLLLAALTVRLTSEVRGLRGQIEIAEAMGRASVTEPEELNAEKLLTRFLTLAQELVASDRALVWTMDQETGILTPAAALPDRGLWANEEAIFGEGLIGHAAARVRPRLIADASCDPHRKRREIASGAWLLYPIVVHERLLGVVQWTRPVSRPFAEEDILRLDTLIPQAAVALENVRIRQAMHTLAATDGLTGLWNHRKMHELLREEMRRSSRYHRALSVLMLDVDSFKTFNDTYGHPQGDQLLRNISAILRAGVRTVDFVGRYGGEEFLVLLPETTKDAACRMAERIRSDVEAGAVIMIDGKPIRRTVSVGVASYPEDALSPAEIVQRADEALYRAKRAGKNCVIWA